MMDILKTAGALVLIVFIFPFLPPVFSLFTPEWASWIGFIGAAVCVAVMTEESSNNFLFDKRWKPGLMAVMLVIGSSLVLPSDLEQGALKKELAHPNETDPEAYARTTGAAEARESKIAGSKRSVLECEPTQHRDWSNQCARVIGHVETLFKPATEPSKLAIIYDGKQVRIMALVREAYHKKFFTTEPPVLAIYSGDRYVPDRAFFNERFRLTLKIGDKVVPLSWQGREHYAISAEDTESTLKLLKAADKAEIEFVHYTYGKGQKKLVSLLGFTAALASFIKFDPQVSSKQRETRGDIEAKRQADAAAMAKEDGDAGRVRRIQREIESLKNYKVDPYLTSRQNIMLGLAGLGAGVQILEEAKAAGLESSHAGF